MEEALKRFQNEYPGLKVTGYWRVSVGYIFNVKVPEDYIGASQFIVPKVGAIRPTNPLAGNFEPSEMNPIRG